MSLYGQIDQMERPRQAKGKTARLRYTCNGLSLYTCYIHQRGPVTHVINRRDFVTQVL